MEKNILGPVHHDSILGRMVGDDMRAEKAVASLPPQIREVLIRDAIRIMHEDLEVTEDSIFVRPPAKTETGGKSLDAVLPRMGRKSHLVIRDDDLKLLDAICAGAQAAAGAGFFALSTSSSSEIAALTGVLLSTFKLVRQLRAKGASVDPVMVQVILALRSRGPMELGDLVDWLNGELKYGQDRWTGETVLKHLEALKRVRLGDGTLTSFVDVDESGKWSAAGV
jgi:hypothetical protein